MTVRRFSLLTVSRRPSSFLKCPQVRRGTAEGESDVNALVPQRAPRGRMEEADRGEGAVGPPRPLELALVEIDEVLVLDLEVEGERIVGGVALGEVESGDLG